MTAAIQVNGDFPNFEQPYLFYLLVDQPETCKGTLTLIFLCCIKI